MPHQRIPITIITGFLGAGKTTLLKRLLADPQGVRIAFILNEVEQPGIDGPMPSVTRFVELSQGCVCCVLNPNLIDTINDIIKRGDIDQIIIETTGLADPLPLIWTIEKPELAPFVRLDCVVTLIDVLNYTQVKNSEWESQVQCADLIIFSKVDMALDEQVKQAQNDILAYNPQAHTLFGNSHFPIHLILQHKRSEEARTPMGSRAWANHSGFESMSYQSTKTFALTPLEDFLESLPRTVFRAKGIVKTERGFVSFHVVAGRLQLEFEVPAPTHQETRMAFFGQKLDKGQLGQHLDTLVIE